MKTTKEVYVPIRFKKLNEKEKKIDSKRNNIVTNDFFGYIFLNDNELENLKNRNIDKKSELYRKLCEQRFIIEDSIDADMIIQRRKEQLENIRKGPSLHIIVVTNRCNQKCIYCHASAKNSENKSLDMKKETAKKVTETIMSSPNPYITIEFQGGEPLINFEIVKYIYDYSQELNNKRPKNKKKSIGYSLVTNMELMDDEKLDYMVERRFGLCTSLDGPQFLHDNNRPSIKTQSSYEDTIKWLKKAKEKGIKPGALITVSKESLKYPKEIVDEYLKQGYATLHLRELNFLGRAAGAWKNIGYTAEEFIEFWEKAMDYIIELNLKGTYIVERKTRIILRKALENFEPQYLDLMSPCGAVIGQISYNHDGRIFSCDEARTIDEDIFQVGDLNKNTEYNHIDKKEKNDQDISQDNNNNKINSNDDDDNINTTIPSIVKSQKAIDIISSTINDSYYCNYCPYKPYCGVCPVCNYIETGTPICDVLRTGRCKVLMAQFDYIFEKMMDPKVMDVFRSWINQNTYKEKISF